jgi:hypothetical protein
VEIIERLVEEYFSGSSEMERRSGEPCSWSGTRQAITASRALTWSVSAGTRKVKRLAEQLETEAATEFRDLSIAASFRSAQSVLDGRRGNRYRWPEAGPASHLNRTVRITHRAGTAEVGTVRGRREP